MVFDLRAIDRDRQTMEVNFQLAVNEGESDPLPPWALRRVLHRYAQPADPTSALHLRAIPLNCNPPQKQRDQKHQPQESSRTSSGMTL